MQLEKNIRTLESILTFYKYIYTGELRKIFYVELKCVLFPLSRITIWKKKRDLYVLWISIYIDKNISKQNIDLVSSFEKKKIISNVDLKVVSYFQSEFSTRVSKGFTGWIVDRECCQLSPHCHAYVAVTSPIGNESALISETIRIRRVLRVVDTNVNHDFAKSFSPLHSCAWRRGSTRVSRLPVYSLFPPRYLIDRL